MTRVDLIPGEVLLAAGQLVDLVEPAREKEYRLPETRREALKELDLLLSRSGWLLAVDGMTEHRWASAQRTAQKLLDFIFEGHEAHDPRKTAAA